MLKNLLKDNRQAIVETWHDLVLKTYPKDTERFLKKTRDPIANPVGSTIKQELENIYDELIGEQRKEVFEAAIDNVIKIRSVQEFTAARAVGIIYYLKTAVRKRLLDRLDSPSDFKDLLELESLIDSLVLLAFSSYSGCREKVYEIRIKEIKATSIRSFDRVITRRRNKKVGEDDSESQKK